jgi:hypothetical protein
VCSVRLPSCAWLHEPVVLEICDKVEGNEPRAAGFRRHGTTYRKPSQDAARPFRRAAKTMLTAQPGHVLRPPARAQPSGPDSDNGAAGTTPRGRAGGRRGPCCRAPTLWGSTADDRIRDRSRRNQDAIFAARSRSDQSFRTAVRSIAKARRRWGLDAPGAALNGSALGTTTRRSAIATRRLIVAQE